MRHTMTNTGQSRLLSSEDKLVKLVPKGMPVINSKSKPYSTIDPVRITTQSTLAFPQISEKLINTSTYNKRIKATINLAFREPQTQQELLDETSKHLKRVYLFATIRERTITLNDESYTGYTINLDTEGFNAILTENGYIRVDTLTYYYAVITDISIVDEQIPQQIYKDAYLYSETSKTTGWEFNTCTFEDGGNYYLHNVQYLNGFYFAETYANGSYLVYSTDGINWSFAKTPSGGKVYYNYNIVFGKDKWIMHEFEYSNMSYSLDGITWQSVSNRPFAKIYGLCYGNNMWVLISRPSFNSSTPTKEQIDGIYSSEDGLTWTKEVSTNQEMLAFGGGRFITGSLDQILGPDSHGDYETNTYYGYTSVNGKDWSACSGLRASRSSEPFLYTTQGWYGTNYTSASSWTGDSSFLKTSNDGVSWNYTGLGRSTSPCVLCYAEDILHYRNNKELYYRKNGGTSTKCNIPASLTIQKILYANGLWVAATSTSAAEADRGLYYSRDGINWNKIPLQVSGGGSYLSYANGLWYYSSGGTYIFKDNPEITGKFIW